MPDEPVGRPRDTRLHHAILDATRELLTTGSYAELSMESVAAHARVGKKTLYRRWSSKAPLVAEAVLEAYGGSGSFPVAETGDIRADLRSWLNEHADFLAAPTNAALVRALVAAAAARPADGEDLYQQLSAAQLAGLMTRLRHGVRGWTAPRRRRPRCDRRCVDRHVALPRANPARKRRSRQRTLGRTPRRVTPRRGQG